MTIRYWDIPRAVLLDTERAFKAHRHEVFVLWTAVRDDLSTTCAIQRCVVPQQQAGATPFGVYVHIDGSELSQIQFESYDRGERSAVQLHTHPGADVRMSDLDRQWEVLTHDSALSIIAPWYAARGLVGFPGANVYERSGEQWRLWEHAELHERLRIVP